MKKLIPAISIFFLLQLFIGCTTQYQPDLPSIDKDKLEADFQQPPLDTRPGCYWYWINDNISKEGITKDLESMARVGIGRAYIGHIYNYSPGSNNARYQTPVGDVQFMTDAWWEAVQWAVREADRCGVEIGFFNSPGWSQSGGPWIKPSQSMRYLAHRETLISGGKMIDQVIPAPEVTTYPTAGGSRPVQTGPKFTYEDYQDVRIIAFRQPETESTDLDMKQVILSSAHIYNLENLTDNSEMSFALFEGEKELVLDIEVPETEPGKTGIQSMSLLPMDIRYVLQCTIKSSDDGETYQKIGEYAEQRGHQGAKIKEAIYIPFTETKAKYLRFIFKLSNNARFSEFDLSRKAVLGGYVRKQLGETDPSTIISWDAYIWPDQDKPADGTVVVSGDVIDLTDKMDANGRLQWDAPEGNWVVLRMGMIPMGTQNAPSSPESTGLEVDKMNKEHVEAHFEGMVGKFLKRTPEAERKALKYIIADSYETGPQNWTDGFAERFESRFGYSPERFLPVFTGRVVDSPEKSDRFLWDVRRIIAEGIAYEYVGGLREISNSNDLTLWLENYGHWGFPAEFLLYGSQTDQVGGEFWTRGVKNNIECRAAVSSAHIYGKNSVYAEAFTSGQTFTHSPASLKKWCDWVFGVGVNHLILHVNIHQPDERKPGIIQWFGTDFNRHNLWFEQSKGFVDYIRRGAVMLKAGLPVVDVAYYTGENAPMMEGPMSPELPDGYEFDFINSDVLINRCSVVNRRIVVENGPSFALLVLSEQEEMLPELAAAIENLVSQGATILGPKPSKSPSLENYPSCDNEVKELAEKIWGEVDGEKVKSGRYGDGFVYDGVGISEVLQQKDILADVMVNEGSGMRCASAGSGNLGIMENGGLVFRHRKAANMDIYFLANTTVKSVDLEVSMRISGYQPSLWNAVTGEMNDQVAYSEEGGRTNIPLHLDASESVYVVFTKDGKRGASKSLPGNEPEYKTLVELDGQWKVQFEGQGAPDEITMDQLTDWSKHSNPAIQHYSGTAVYKRSFTLENLNKETPVVLELGDVSVISKVFVNGKEAGVVWTTPWEIDITELLSEGRNELEIQVTNNWYNRVLADSRLPEDKRLTYTSQPYGFGKNPSLQKSGLLGPVRIAQVFFHVSK